MRHLAPYVLVIALAMIALAGCRSPLDPDEDRPAPKWVGYVVKRAR